MSSDLIINSRVTIPVAELVYMASRASGPGGQHVNTSDTRIQLRWSIRDSVALNDSQKERLEKAFASRLTESGELILSCGSNRSQRRNKEEVTQRLAAIVRQALVPVRPRRATKPTRASKERRLSDKKRRSQTKRNRRGKPDDHD